MSSKMELIEEGRAEGRKDLAQAIACLLWPEDYPPGDPLHDPEHIYWDGQHEYESAYQWSADTIEWVAEAVARELA
jgi:hypothetical protein